MKNLFRDTCLLFAPKSNSQFLWGAETSENQNTVQGANPEELLIDNTLEGIGNLLEDPNKFDEALQKLDEIVEADKDMTRSYAKAVFEKQKEVFGKILKNSNSGNKVLEDMKTQFDNLVDQNGNNCAMLLRKTVVALDALAKASATALVEVEKTNEAKSSSAGKPLPPLTFPKGKSGFEQALETTPLPKVNLAPLPFEKRAPEQKFKIDPPSLTKKTSFGLSPDLQKNPFAAPKIDLVSPSSLTEAPVDKVPETETPVNEAPQYTEWQKNTRKEGSALLESLKSSFASYGITSAEGDIGKRGGLKGIQELQKHLIESGFDLSTAGGADGLLGDKTKEAWEKYKTLEQKLSDADKGLVGSARAEKIKTLLAAEKAVVANGGTVAPGAKTAAQPVDLGESGPPTYPNYVEKHDPKEVVKDVPMGSPAFWQSTFAPEKSPSDTGPQKPVEGATSPEKTLSPEEQEKYNKAWEKIVYSSSEMDLGKSDWEKVKDLTVADLAELVAFQNIWEETSNGRFTKKYEAGKQQHPQGFELFKMRNQVNHPNYIGELDFGDLIDWLKGENGLMGKTFLSQDKNMSLDDFIKQQSANQ